MLPWYSRSQKSANGDIGHILPLLGLLSGRVCAAFMSDRAKKDDPHCDPPHLFLRGGLI